MTPGVEMVDHAPRSSLVIPVRNRPELLGQCLASLRRQTFALEEIEILVVDDGSSENIGAVVGQHQPGIPHLRLLRQEAKGPAAARNLGIRESCAPVVIFLDSDVLPEPEMLRELIDGLERHPHWRGAEARIEPVGGEESPLWDSPVCSAGGRYQTAAIAYRREALMEAGGFDETFTLAACEDVEMASRILARGPIGFVPTAVALHPRRRVTLRTFFFWRRHWRYCMVLAKRYGFVGFPGRPATRFPRLRVALAAWVTLPVGQFLKGIRHMRRRPLEGALASLYAMVNVGLSMISLPEILFGSVPLRISYLSPKAESCGKHGIEPEALYD